MKVTVAIDSFKGSVSSEEAGAAIKAGILAADHNARVYVAPLADGGEGTVDAFLSALGGRKYSCEVCGPLGEMIVSEFGITDDGTAIIEIAEAAGLPLVPKEKRSPLYTTTFGVGQMILKAIELGARKFIIGLGGSATNDGGAGMLSALGYKLLDGEGNPIPQGAIGLKSLKTIDTSSAVAELSECSFIAACDVKNPLLGENGASYVFAPQKGAGKDEVHILESLLSGFANLTREVLSRSHENDEGAGAAGGLGFALISYLGAKLKSGIELLIGASEIEENIKSSDLVITGEGRLDGQSAMGKAPYGIARLAKAHGKPTVALCGAVGDGAASCNLCGIDAYFPIAAGPCTLDYAMDKHVTMENLSRCTEQVMRLFLAGAERK